MLAPESRYNKEQLGEAPGNGAMQMKWHGIVVSMMACGPEDPGSIPCLAKVHNEVIFFLGVLMIQFHLL